MLYEKHITNGLMCSDVSKHFPNCSLGGTYMLC